MINSQDKIPGMIEADGHIPKVTSLGNDDYLVALKAKLVEESEEVREAGGTAEVTTELGDVLEVMTSICDAIGLPFASVLESRDIRAEKRGRFEQKLFLHYVDEQQARPPDSSGFK